MSRGLVVPEIPFGDRLMRPWQLRDTAVLKEAADDPYIPLITTVPRKWSEDSARCFVNRQTQRSDERVGYPFAIVDEQDTVVGHIGLWTRDLDLGRASIGYWIVASARGRGIASAALTALSEWAFSKLRIPRVELYIEPWNTASIKTAEKSGFICEGLLRSWCEIGGKRTDMRMFSKINPTLHRFISILQAGALQHRANFREPNGPLDSVSISRQISTNVDTGFPGLTRLHHRPDALRKYVNIEFIGLLRQRNFMLFIAGQTISRVGNSAYTVGLSWTVYSITGSSGVMGALLALNSLPQLVFAFIGGALGDKISRRAVIIVADGLAGATLTALALCAAFHALNVTILMSAALALGAVSAFYSPAYSAINQDLLRTEQLRTANSIITICKNAALVTGPALAGIVYALDGAKGIFAVDSLSFGISVAAMLLIRVPGDGQKHEDAGTGMLRGATEGFRYTVRISWLRLIMILSVVSNVACMAPFAVLLAGLVREYHQGVYMLSMLTSLQIAGAIAGSVIIASSKRFIRRPIPVLIILAAMIGAGTVTLGASDGISIVLFGGSLLMGIGLSFDIVENTLMQTLVPGNILSRVYGINSLVSFSLLPVGYALSGIIAGLVGPAWVLASGGILLLITCTLAGVVQSMRDLEIESN